MMSYSWMMFGCFNVLSSRSSRRSLLAAASCSIPCSTRLTATSRCGGSFDESRADQMIPCEPRPTLLWM